MVANYALKESVSPKQIISKWNIILEDYLYKRESNLLLFLGNIFLVSNNNNNFFMFLKNFRLLKSIILEWVFK